jgi:hypothetical protein
MADGWSDKEKSDAGLAAVFRVTPAISFAQWLEWLGWNAQTWQTRTSTNSEGFADAYVNFVCNTAPYSSVNATADFWLVTRTDRPAWLTVADALTTNSFPVRAGSSRVRLRAAYGGPVALTLDPHPGTLAQAPGATNGLWLCEMNIVPFGSNTVVFSDGVTPPSVPGNPDSVNGLLLLAPPPAAAIHSLTSPPPRVNLQPLRMTDGAAVLGNGGWYCLCASVPPCDWPNYALIGCDAVSMAMNSVEGSTPLMPKDDARDIYGARSPCIQCTVTQTVANVVYPFIYGRVIFSFRQCEAIGGLVLGAETNLPLHEPACYEFTGCGGIGCVCLDDGNTYVGFDHALVNTRNLDLISVANSEENTVNHCLGVVWSANGKVDFFSLLGGTYTSYNSDLQFTTDNLTVNDGELEFGDKPKDLEPNICLIKLHYKPSPDVDQVFDKLWVVVNRPDTQTNFNTWYAQNSDISWTTNLPPPFSKLTLSTNAEQEVSADDPEPSVFGGHWHPPESKNSYLHHNGKYEMRSKPIASYHGHQAMYDAHGILITEPIAAGTADFFAPYNSINWPYWDRDHREQDVYPYIRALQLDGNPVHPNSTFAPTNLNRPCIYKGVKTDEYFEKRPVLPTGKQ